jgi:hypothetical protein
MKMSYFVTDAICFLQDVTTILILYHRKLLVPGVVAVDGDEYLVVDHDDGDAGAGKYVTGVHGWPVFDFIWLGGTLSLLYRNHIFWSGMLVPTPVHISLHPSIQAILLAIKIAVLSHSFFCMYDRNCARNQSCFPSR